VINSLSADGFADSYKFISAIVAATDSTAPGFAQTAAFNAEVNNTTPVTLYTSNRPQNLTGVDDFRLTVSAQPNIQTPAGDYSDKVVLTVTGNF
jgi:DNA-directed RNA polymerase